MKMKRPLVFVLVFASAIMPSSSIFGSSVTVQSHVEMSNVGFPYPDPNLWNVQATATGTINTLDSSHVGAVFSVVARVFRDTTGTACQSETVFSEKGNLTIANNSGQTLSITPQTGLTSCFYYHRSWGSAGLVKNGQTLAAQAKYANNCQKKC